jgi:hypothetical protein
VSRCWPVVLIIAALLAPLAARAHPLLPAALTLVEGRSGHYALRFRRPARMRHPLAPLLPSGCVLGEVRSSQELDQSVDAAELVCAGGLERRTLGVTGLAAAELDAIVHVQHRSGESARALLSARRERFVVPARTSWSQVLWQYGQLGARHMLEGPDHLLFTLGLALLGAGVRALWLLTAFSLGHSVTLALFAASTLSLPQAPVELGIALSLIGLALSVLARARAPDGSLSARRAPAASAAVCFAVGLLHGLGFAEGLKQLSLPAHALLSALLGFNLGIELAQVALLGALAPGLWLAMRAGPRALRGLRTTAAYATGSLAAMWCIERALAWLH